MQDEIEDMVFQILAWDCDTQVSLAVMGPLQ
jgi:hypothetical protein